LNQDEISFSEPDSHFAPAERIDGFYLNRDIETVRSNEVIKGLMVSIQGLLAVLNEHRQILAVNDCYLQMLGLSAADEILGLRPGESIQCVYSHLEPGGCGTSEYCSSCGAAIAIVSSLQDGKPMERKCVIRRKQNHESEDICLHVKASPLGIGNKTYVLLFLQDITLEERSASLERVFFHDINNIITGLLGTSNLLLKRGDQSNYKYINSIRFLSSQLASEMAIQKALLHQNHCNYPLLIRKVLVIQIFQELKEMLANHPAAKNKRLHFVDSDPLAYFETDSSLLLRILGNMLINAFEATEEDGEVRCRFEQEDSGVSFHVWNRRVIAPEVARRIFQCHFTTKKQKGRGLGTYAMKLLGEQYLNGNVSFISVEPEGTTFRIVLPKNMKQENDHEIL
jgi:hypothetical protein